MIANSQVLASLIEEAQTALAKARYYLCGDTDTPGDGPGRYADIHYEACNAHFAISHALHIMEKDIRK